MAIKSIAATFDGNNGYQNSTYSWLSGYSSVDLNVGTSGSLYYPFILKFTTPSFSGESTSITFNFAMRYRNQLNIHARYAICSSDANRDLYVNKSGAVTDEYQIATGTNTFTVNGSGTTYNVPLKVSTAGLKPDTTYYLYLWADGSGYASIMTSAAVPTVTLYYVDAYKLTITAGEGSTVTVNRSSSAYGSTGEISDGATIYADDVLAITFAAESGYELLTHTVNGASFTSGGTHTVSADVVIVIATNRLGLIYIDNGTTVEAYMIYIDNGSSWDQYVPYVDNGSGWDLCG